MSEYRAYNGKIDYDVDMWSNGDMYRSQYDNQRVYTDNIISSNTQNTYTVRDTSVDDQFEEQTQTIERYITAMEQFQELDQTIEAQEATEATQTEQVVQTQQTQQTQQVQQATQTQQIAQQQVTQTQQTQQQTTQYTTGEVQNLYDEQVDQAFDDIEVLT